MFGSRRRIPYPPVPSPRLCSNRMESSRIEKVRPGVWRSLWTGPEWTRFIVESDEDVWGLWWYCFAANLFPWGHRLFGRLTLGSRQNDMSKWRGRFRRRFNRHGVVFIVADEPSAGLDPRARRELIRLIVVAADCGHHDVDLARAVLPRCVIMNPGSGGRARVNSGDQEFLESRPVDGL